MMDYTQAKAERDRLEAECKKAAEPLKAFPRNPMGLVSDEIKRSAAYKTAKTAHDAAFAQLRAFNADFVKKFKQDIRNDRKCP